MMPEHELTWLSLSIVAAYLIWRQFNSLFREQLRFEIITIREDLFMKVLSAGEDFRDPSYMEARSCLNTLLKMSNDCSFLQMLLFSVSARAVDDEQPDAEISRVGEWCSEALSDAGSAYYRYLYRNPIRWRMTYYFFWSLIPCLKVLRWLTVRLKKTDVREDVHLSAPPRDNINVRGQAWLFRNFAGITQAG